MLAIGVEIGGRGQRVVLVGAQGRIVDTVHAIDRGATAAGIVDTVCLLIEQLLGRRNLAPSAIRGIGIAFGGPVDAERGLTIRSHRTEGFGQFPIASLLEDRFGIHTVLENDARAAALGEHTYGAGRGSRTMFYLHLGAGVGGGVIVNGRLHHGASMTSGEIGHMVVSANGPLCSCGKPGHLEAYASEQAIVERMRLQLADAPPEATAAWLASSGISVRRIFAAYPADEHARIVVDEVVQVIGLALANLVTAFNPDSVIIGGFVAEAGAQLIAEVRAKIRQYAFDAAARHVTVSVGQLGGDAGVIGAVVRALDLA
jgi:glucokinase